MSALERDCWATICMRTVVINPVMYCDCTGTCQHNGVAYGMGADCPSCMAGITKPEYDKIPVAQPSQTEDTNYEQYYIEKANESVLEHVDTKVKI